MACVLHLASEALLHCLSSRFNGYLGVCAWNVHSDYTYYLDQLVSQSVKKIPCIHQFGIFTYTDQLRRLRF